MSSRKQFGFRLIALGLALLATIGASELAVRLAGHRPWPAERTLDRPPGLHDLDDTLGWVPQPGVHDEGGRVTVLPDRSRATAEAPPVVDPDVVIVGGSFAFGQEVPDAETFAWKLQSTLGSGHHVVNLGTPAHGTYQALLRLERFFERQPRGVKAVIYPFATFHEDRNVASAAWRGMLERGNTETLFRIPYCTLDGAGGLVRHAPEPNSPKWPLRRQLALVPFLAERYTQWRTSGREAIKQEVTLALIDELRRSATDHGAELLVAFIFDTDVQMYRDALSSAGIRFVDCNDRRILTGEWRVPGSIHPDGRGHTHYASCMASGLERLDVTPTTREP